VLMGVAVRLVAGRSLGVRISARETSGDATPFQGLSLQTLSSEERLRLAPFLTVLGTHSISER